MDYTAGPYTVTFPAGTTSALVIVPLNDDDLIERDENFTLSFDLSSLPSGIATGISNQTLVIINDNDCKFFVYRKSGNVLGKIIFVGTFVPRKLNT